MAGLARGKEKHGEARVSGCREDNGRGRSFVFPLFILVSRVQKIKNFKLAIRHFLLEGMCF